MAGVGEDVGGTELQICCVIGELVAISPSVCWTFPEPRAKSLLFLAFSSGEDPFLGENGAVIFKAPHLF